MRLSTASTEIVSNIFCCSIGGVKTPDTKEILGKLSNANWFQIPEPDIRATDLNSLAFFLPLYFGTLDAFVYWNTENLIKLNLLRMRLKSFEYCRLVIRTWRLWISLKVWLELFTIHRWHKVITTLWSNRNGGNYVETLRLILDGRWDMKIFFHLNIKWLFWTLIMYWNENLNRAACRSLFP